MGDSGTVALGHTPGRFQPLVLLPRASCASPSAAKPQHCKGIITHTRAREERHRRAGGAAALPSQQLAGTQGDALLTRPTVSNALARVFCCMSWNEIVQAAGEPRVLGRLSRFRSLLSPPGKSDSSWWPFPAVCLRRHRPSPKCCRPKSSPVEGCRRAAATLPVAATRQFQGSDGSGCPNMQRR